MRFAALALLATLGLGLAACGSRETVWFYSRTVTTETQYQLNERVTVRLDAASIEEAIHYLEANFQLRAQLVQRDAETRQVPIKIWMQEVKLGDLIQSIAYAHGASVRLVDDEYGMLIRFEEQ